MSAAAVRVTPLISKLSDYQPKPKADYKPWNRYIYEDLGVVNPSTQVADDKVHYLQLCFMFITHIGNQFVRSVSKCMSVAEGKGRTETNVGYAIHSGTYHVLIENGDQKYVAVVDRGQLQKRKFVDSDGNTVVINPRNVVKSTDLVCGPPANRNIFKENKMLSLAEFVAEQVSDKADTFIVYNNKPVLTADKKPSLDKQNRPIYDKLYYINLRWGPSKTDYGYYTPAADYNKPTFKNPAKKQGKQSKQTKQNQKQQTDEKTNPNQNKFDALEQESDGSSVSEVIMSSDAALVSSSLAKALEQQQQSYAAAAATSVTEQVTSSP